jgi:GGDEF domain-containing protein
MDLVSIKKFLRPGKPRPEDYIRFLQLLLQGISLHAVEADEKDLFRFRHEISEISERLSDQSSADDILVAVGTVIRAMSENSRTTARHTHAYLRELQTMLAMMTETIAFLSASSKTGVEQLHNVEKNLQKASSIDDIRVLRGKLDDCLTMVRNERNRIREESQTRITALREGVERTASHVRLADITQVTDPATGLPGRGAAEEMIAAKISVGKDFVIALFLVDRLSHVNARLGRKVGDEILLEVAQHIGQQPVAGSLFRWSGPAFILISDIHPSLSAVQRQMKRIASMRIEKTVETEGRSILLLVTCSFMIQEISARDSLEALGRNFDRFVAAQTGEGEQGLGSE